MDMLYEPRCEDILLTGDPVGCASPACMRWRIRTTGRIHPAVDRANSVSGRLPVTCVTYNPPG